METKVGIKFAKALLVGYLLIEAAGKYLVKVQNNVGDQNLYTDEQGNTRYIVSLKAIMKDKLPQVLEVFKGVDEVDIEATNGLFATASIFKNGDNTPALPMKGEEVEVICGYVPDRDGVEVLRVTNIHVLPAKKAVGLDLAAIEKAAAEAATAEAEAKKELEHA